jgi:response regulator of citrate/malate metabolism
MAYPIFLVEDDPKLQLTLQDAISTFCEGEVVGVAETEAHALSWLKGHPNGWQLTVLDLYLKVGTGFGVLEKLSSAARRRVIVLTNSATAENRKRCLSMGVLAVYDKTSELEHFLDHCHRHQTTGV